MKICIVGCGAIGSLFAAHLARLHDVEVWAYDLDKAHVDAINENGLRLSGMSELISRPRATTQAHDIPPCDFGIVATKALHTRPAIEATATIFAMPPRRWKGAQLAEVPAESRPVKMNSSVPSGRYRPDVPTSRA